MDDPTLLFTNAGMNQFKDVFLGTGKRPYTRAADTQKCIRVSGKHNDLEEVGFDTYHHTFFEMLGNWSFGDYYKEEAIAWAWELVTKIWGLPREQLWATVFREDNEAEGFWKKMTDIDSSHILRFDEKDNFWEMGETGPCGPCSEIHIDLGEGFCDKKGEKGHVCGVNTGCSRYIELWNLVFIQFNRDESGKLQPLPMRHVDTGLGFERIVSVIQKKRSNYDTDLFKPILDHIEDLTGISSQDSKAVSAFRVIADHIRALTFAITDGALPSNEGRGYVLRRILRRAARYGRNLGMHEPFIYKLVSTVVDQMESVFPETGERAAHCTTVIKAEEERFNEVLDRGIGLFESISADIKKKGQTSIPGKDAFRLYDTYGFPLDLTELMAREQGLSVDSKAFNREMEKQREKARESHHFSMDDEGEWDVLSGGEDSLFVGYEFLSTESEIRKVRQNGKQVSIILDKTPFYAESGGQVGDQGRITGDKFSIQIEDTQKQGDQIIHMGTLIEGDTVSSAHVTAVVEEESRLSTARNHTSTHLLHKALKEVLGEHVNQAGSLVSPDRLRFDFTHFEPMTSEQIDQVEFIVNKHVRRNHDVNKYITSYKEAREKGVTALFGEKYEDQVRVIQIDDYSMELCGGTHIERTGEIGYFRIVSEEGIAAGVRRIEAETGRTADTRLRKDKHILSAVEKLLKCQRDELEERIQAFIEDRKEIERKYKKLQKSSAVSDSDDLLQKAVPVDDFRVISTSIEIDSVDHLRTVGDRVREKLDSGVGIFGAVLEGKVHFICVVTDDLIRSKKIRAGDIVKQVAQIADGSGGGKPHLALAGAKRIDKMQEALDAGPEIVRKFIKNT